MSEELKACRFCGEQAYTAGVTDENKVIYCAHGKCPAFNTGYPESVWQSRPIEDAQATHIAELEAKVDSVAVNMAKQYAKVVLNFQAAVVASTAYSCHREIKGLFDEALQPTELGGRTYFHSDEAAEKQLTKVIGQRDKAAESLERFNLEIPNDKSANFYKGMLRAYIYGIESTIKDITNE